MLTDEERGRLACRASTLEERFSDAMVPVASELGERLSAGRLRRWSAYAAAGDPSRLERRWHFDLYQQVPERLGSIEWREGAELPDWLPFLERVLERPAEHGFVDAPRVPFEELALPFVAEASRGLDLGPLSACATTLERTLAGRLGRFLSQPALARFEERRQGRQGEGHDLYRAFVLETLGTFKEFFLEYSALGRVLVDMCRAWRSSTSLLAARLHADLPALTECFGLPAAARVSSIDAECSDLHPGGQYVSQLTFDGGRRLYYKPRSCGPEDAFFRLCEELNRRLPPPSLPLLRAVYRADYAWIEEAVARPEPDDFRRYGRILAAATVLGTTDLHRHNLVGPVLVDAETLIQPSWAPLSEPLLTLRDSVLRTSMLPAWEIGSQGELYDRSALGATAETTEQAWNVWEGLGTDAITVSSRVMPARKFEAPRSVTVDDVVEGFEETYRLIADHRDEWLGDSSALVFLASQRYRFVLRDTSFYSGLARRLQAPEFLRQGVDRSLELEGLSHAWLSSPERPRLWPLVAEERAALWRGEIPYFQFDLATDRIAALPAGFGDPRSYLAERLDRHTASRMELQTRLIRSSFCLGHDQDHGDSFHDARAAHAANGEHDLLRQEALQIGREIKRLAVWGDEGVDWISLVRLSGKRGYELALLGDGLYDGKAGLALFLARLEVETVGGFRELALAALESLRDRLQAGPFPGHGLEGLGGALYVLGCVGRWLELDELVDEARQAALQHLPEDPVDAPTDLMGGVAGTLLGLLSLTPTDRLLDRAARWGRGLETAGSPVPGLAHGFSGPALALARLAHATGDSSFGAAAARLFDREAQLALPPLTSWCNGLPGMEIAKLAARRFWPLSGGSPPDQTFAEVQVSNGWDYLCCGVMGNLELLMLSARDFGRPDLLQQARARAGEIVAAARVAGGYRLLNGPVRDILRPGFFQGTAGIGYQLLRLAAPERVPSVLVMDAR